MGRKAAAASLQLGAGLASTSVGIAIAASGIDGLALAIISWSAVAVGLGLMLGGWTSLHRKKPRSRRRRRGLRNRLDALGHEIVVFARDREAQAPPPPH